MNTRFRRLGATLIDVLVVADIVGVLAALLLPSIQTAREMARRHVCQNKMRQLMVAMHSHAEHQMQFPLASTRPYRVGSMNCRIVAHGRQHPEYPADPDDPADGFSWFVQIMPDMGYQALYDQLSANTGGFQGGPWHPDNTIDGTHATNHIGSVQIEQLRCPSFPGGDVAVTRGHVFGGAEFGVIANIGPGASQSIPAVSNYIPLVATHFENINSKILIEDSGTHAGNGAIVFPRVVGSGATARLTKHGLPFRAIRDGMAHTLALTETRETGYTTWLSGLVYGMGVWPQSPDQSAISPGPDRAPDGLFGWNADELADLSNRISLNQGSDSDIALGIDSSEVHYMERGQYPHGCRGVKWGPSSAHPGLVIHAYCDGHVEEIAETIDRNTYLRLITRYARNPDHGQRWRL